MATPHRLMLITTGGTIAGQVAADDHDEAMKRTAEAFSGLIGPTVSYLESRLELEISIEPHPLDPLNPQGVDSSNIMPEHWRQLAHTIRDNYDSYDSFVITHGTNTLGYTCAALSFAIANPTKPIILTGSQVPAGLPGSDALTNLDNAIRVAVWPREGEGVQLRGVMAVFGSHIITGTRVKKDTEFDYDAFKSFSAGSIGRIGRIINIDNGNLKKHSAYHSTGTYAPAKKASDLRCDADFDMRIASLTEYPGMPSDMIRALVDGSDVQGFILRAFGAGDPCEAHHDVFRYLKERQIPLVVTTQAPNGNSNFQVNVPGKMLRDEQLAIPAYDMSIESITTKLGWLLAQKRRRALSYEQLCQEMVHDIRGEINVMWEVGV